MGYHRPPVPRARSSTSLAKSIGLLEPHPVRGSEPPPPPDGAKPKRLRRKKAPTIQVRRIHRRDLNTVWEFLKLSFRDVNRATVEYQRPRTKQRFLETYEEEGVEQLLFTVDRQIVAYAECTFEIVGKDTWVNPAYFERRDMRPLYVEELAVHPDWGGAASAGSSWSSSSTSRAIRGLTHLVLEVAENNENALAGTASEGSESSTRPSSSRKAWRPSRSFSRRASSRRRGPTTTRAGRRKGARGLMAKAHTEWTVLEHGPIEKLADNLWRVDGTLPGMSLHRVMTIAKLGDGRLAVHNAIALREPEMKEIDAWGTVALILVPNGFHRLDAPAFKSRYPGAKVLAPKGSRKKVEEVVAVDGTYDDFPKDDAVRLESLRGVKGQEGAMVVRIVRRCNRRPQRRRLQHAEEAERRDGMAHHVGVRIGPRAARLTALQVVRHRRPPGAPRGPQSAGGDSGPHAPHRFARRARAGPRGAVGAA